MNLSNYILKNGTVYLNQEFVKKDIEIKDGIVVQIEDSLTGENIIDCQNKLITPSFIDGHVHFRTPGFEYKEDIKTGSMAALKGGYSHVCEMPNTNPTLDDVETIQAHLKQIEQEAYCYVIPFSGATTNLAGKEMVDIEKISLLAIEGFSDDGKGIQDDEMMEKVLIKAGKYHKLVSAHCEDEAEFVNGMGAINEGITASKNNIKAINNKSEWAMIKRDVEIAKIIHGKHEYQYHICHMSTKESLAILKEAKELGLNVSAEVTPHHLISDESQIDINNANYKMNPPLRNKEDVQAMVEGLNSGIIECIATDHAPHSEKEKANPIENAPFGIIGLELAFSLLNTYLVKTKQVELQTILKAMIDNPQRIFKINNSLQINRKAYLNIIDLDKEVQYTKDNLVSKSKNTFYLGQKLRGKVEKTIFENKIYEW